MSETYIVKDEKTTTLKQSCTRLIKRNINELSYTKKILFIA